MTTTTPTIWKQDTILNQGLLLGDQSDPSVILLANGDMICSWIDNRNNVDSSPGLDVVGLRMTMTGDVVGNAFQLNNFVTDGNQTHHEMAALHDGGYLAVYVRDIPSTGEISKIYFDRYSANGALVASGTVAQGNLAYAYPTLAVLSNGDVAISFEGYNWFEVDYSVRERIFHVADNTLTPTVKLEGGGLNATNAWESDTAALRDGGFVTVYKRASLTSESIRYEVRGNDGSLLKKANVVGSLGDDFNSDPKVCALSGGGFAVGWHSTDTSFKPLNVFAKMYDATGNQVGGKVSVATSSSHEAIRDIIGLPDGGFYTVHFNEEASLIVGQRFNAAGEKVGLSNQFTVEDNPSVYPYHSDDSASLSLTQDGRINFVWHSGSDIHHAILDPRDDVIYGTAGNDTLLGQVSTSTIYGLDGNDTILGQSGNETIDGGAGIDVLKGGEGDDMFILKDVNRLDPNKPLSFGYDYVVELANGGTDTVEIERVADLVAAYTLPQFVENAIVVGDRIFDVTGNASDNELTGNIAANTLRGLDGNDRLDGGEGADILEGGLGDDKYLLLNVHRPDPFFPTRYAFDAVVEDPGGGTDTIVIKKVTAFLRSYTLADNVENANFVGTGVFELVGNSLDNKLLGSSAGNTMSGEGGDDRIIGGEGDDLLNGNGGNDTLFGGGPVVSLHQNPDGNDRLNGNGGDDSLSGGDGDDVLNGGNGNDGLRGGAGLDRFVFSSAPGGANADTIADFVVADDTILLKSTQFGGVDLGVLKASAFRIGNAAADANDRIIYNENTGALFFDADGTGGAAQLRFATLAGGLALSNGDFEVI